MMMRENVEKCFLCRCGVVKNRAKLRCCMYPATPIRWRFLPPERVTYAHIERRRRDREIMISSSPPLRLYFSRSAFSLSTYIAND